MSSQNILAKQVCLETSLESSGTALAPEYQAQIKKKKFKKVIFEGLLSK